MNIALVLALCLAGFECAHSASLKIVDGDEAAFIPYQVHLNVETDFLQSWNCSGVLISENYVLTTSKCVWSGPTKVNVTLGVHNVREQESTQQILYSKGNWKIYPSDFAYYTLENNVALVRLPASATLNDNVQVAKLPSSDDVKVGQAGTISGWGGINQELETVLQSASVTIVDNSVCASAYNDLYTGEKVICVKGDNGASGCNGDDGAPLVIDGVVVGIYSGGPIHTTPYLTGNCTDQPNIFTKVNTYLDWIKENSDI